MALGKLNGYFASFLFGFIVRLVPEAIGYPAPIGYNIVAFYAPVLANFHAWGSRILVNLFYPPQWSPLAYILMIPFTLVMRPYAVLATFSPFFYGVLTLVIYRFLRIQGLTTKVTLLGVFFVAIQFPVLRLSWDMPSEILAVSAGVLTLTLLANHATLRRYIILASMLLVTGLAHQVVLVSVLPCIYYKALEVFRRGNSKSALKFVAASIPSVLLLASNLMLLQHAPLVFAYGDGVKMWFFWTEPYASSTSPFINYMAEFGSYRIILLTIVGFPLFLYAPLIPPLVLRRPRESLATVWALFTLLLAVNPLLSPSFAIGFWYLWAIVLSVPLSLVAFTGFVRILRKARAMSTSLMILILFFYSTFGVGFMTLPPERSFVYFASPAFLGYSPSSMLMNTMPLQDSLDTLNLMARLNQTMHQNSVLLVHEAFYGFAALTITGQKNIIDYHLGKVTPAAAYAKQLGFTTIYWVWWTPGYGWHGVPNPPQNFKIAFLSGRMAVYLYNG